MDPNPRKTIRRNIIILDREMASLRKRLHKFEEEKNRLASIEKNGTIEDAHKAVDNWSRYNWFAFPE